MENGAFDIFYYASYVIGTMARMCAPERDDRIAALHDVKDVVPLFRWVGRCFPLRCPPLVVMEKGVSGVGDVISAIDDARVVDSGAGSRVVDQTRWTFSRRPTADGGICCGLWLTSYPRKRVNI